MGWIRNPKTTQERRAAGKRNKVARAKRNMANLPNSYDDFWVGHQRCWKKHRKTKYRTVNQ